MINIPPEILNIYKRIQDNGFEIYFVGGCVRNAFLKRPVKDWDLTTNAKPEEIVKIFPDSFYDNNFGTVGIPHQLGGVVEITTYRTESEYKDRRHPESVSWGETIEEDLSRRDFTINAIALKVVGTDQEIVDPFLGITDLENKIIKAVGDANKRFKEDALRLIRAIRIATELEFTIEENTWEKIKEDSALIKDISSERIQNELLRILSSTNPYQGIVLLKDGGLLQYIIPELLEGEGLSQARPGRHHTTDVFTHNLMSLKETPSKDPIVRLAALLHDIGKPRVEGKDEEDLVTFHNHEIVGAKLANDILERLKFSKKDKEKIVNLIRWHMFTVDEHITDAAVRRFIRRVGVDNVKDMMDLRIGDRLGGGTQTAESWRLKLFKKRVEDQLKPAPFSINDMAVDGNDVIKILNIKPSAIIGDILEELFKEVDEDLSKNNKEYLEKRIRELGEKMVK